jgi:hypothetical protein
VHVPVKIVDRSPVYYHILTVLRREGIRAGMTRRLSVLALYIAVTFKREFVRCSAKYIFVFEPVNNLQVQMSYCIPLGGNSGHISFRCRYTILETLNIMNFSFVFYSVS